MKKNIRLELAMEEDATQIRDLMIEVERDEAARWYEEGERPFIPGFDSAAMQKYHMWDGNYFKVLKDEVLVGVVLVSHTGREHARIDRLYISPTGQGSGTGSKVLELVEQLYPKVILWTLDTTQKSPRNHHFYEKNGYSLVSENEEERYYEKVIGERTSENEEFIVGKDFQKVNFRNCNLENTDFYGGSLKKTHFTNMNLSQQTYQNSNLRNNRFTNTNMSGSVLADSNLNNIEICHVSLAGAHIHDTNLGWYETKKVPLVMDNCELIDSRIINSNLKNLAIENCNMDGMTINGFLVTELLDFYQKPKNCKK